MTEQESPIESGEASGTNATELAASRRELTRRALLGSAGVLAGGAALTAAGAAGPDLAGAAASPARSPEGTTRAEFVAQIAQNGGHLVAYGYFTRIVGIEASSLFEGNPAETTALYTAYAEGDLVSRAVNGPVTVLDVVGTLAVFRRRAPGSGFDDPTSFKVGRRIANFELTLQDVLTVIAPDTGIPTLAGDMKQTSGTSVFGQRGERLRMSATGLGTRSEATAPVAVLNIAGNIVSV